MPKKEYQKKEKNTAAAVLTGVGVSIVVTFVGTLAIALLVMKETISDQSIGYCVLGLTLAASMVGSITTTQILKSKLLIVSLATSVTFALVLLSVTAMFFGGEYRGVAITLPVIIGGGISAVLFSWKKINRPKAYHKR